MKNYTIEEQGERIDTMIYNTPRKENDPVVSFMLNLSAGSVVVGSVVLIILTTIYL
jgi:hypothetical protein